MKKAHDIIKEIMNYYPTHGFGPPLPKSESLLENPMPFRRSVRIARFIEDHDLTREEFATQHWQTLFRIEYPEDAA